MSLRGRPKALLLYPPIYDFALYDLFLKPFGLLRIGRYLREGGWDVEFVNALDYEDAESAAALGRPRRKPDGTGKIFRVPAAWPAGLDPCGRRYSRYGILPESFRRRVAAAAGGAHGSTRSPDIILVSSGMTYWYQGAAEAVRVCRDLYPGVPVVVGGIYATLMPEHCAAATGADTVAAGGGAEDLAAALSRHGLPAPAGPIPERPLLPPEIWGDAGVLRLNMGCPLGCDYCASGRLSPRFESGDPDAAADLVEEFMGMGIGNFAFYDDALLVDKEKIFLPFLERIVERWGRAGEPGRTGPRFYLPNAVHIRHLDSGTATLMRGAGFEEIRMGFESSSAGFHEEHTPLEAKIRPEDFPETVRILSEAGFPLRSLSVYILAGLPGQRAEEAEASIRFAMREKVRVRISEYSPVPGTGLWEESVRLCRYPIEDEPLYHNNSFFPMEWEGFTREDLENLKKLIRSASPAGN